MNSDKKFLKAASEESQLQAWLERKIEINQRKIWIRLEEAWVERELKQDREPHLCCPGT